MDSVLKYGRDIGMFLFYFLGVSLQLALVGLFYIFPQYLIPWSIAFLVITASAYYSGKRAAIISYNKKLITKGTWIRTTSDMRGKTGDTKFTLYSGTLAYVYGINSNRTYDVLINPLHDGYPVSGLRQIGDYRNVEVVPIEEIDSKTQLATMKELQALPV